MDEILNRLLADAILAALARRDDPVKAAEKAAEAYVAAQAAFKKALTLSVEAPPLAPGGYAGSVAAEMVKPSNG